MAAYAALASLMNNIEQIMIHPRLSASLDKYQIPSLHEKSGLLLDFIEGNNYSGVVSKEVEDLERGIARAAHAAEDVIESHIVDQILAGTSKASFTCLVRLQRIIEEMDAVFKYANEFKEKDGLRSLEQPRNSRIHAMEKSGETSMVGFEDELYQLMDGLTSQQSSRNVISIVAMGGTGKTTLAQNVYENLTIKRHFDFCAWATISLQYRAHEILSQLLSVRGNSSHRTVDELGEQLYKTLVGRRYLIILDDVWCVEAWDAVRRFLPDRNGSRVVLTTRLSNVARDCSSSCIMMNPLDGHESWKLFCKKAFKQENCPYPELESVGKEIARLCRGLPLSIVVVGGLLLNSPRSLPFWEMVLHNIRRNHDSKEKQESLDVLSLSYNHLPPHLKPCFLYMGVFKENSKIRVSEIIRLWVAEGFIRPNNNHIPEEIAKGYLKELIDRNLILVRGHHKNGKVGCCGIHDLVRDLCLKVGGEQEFLHMPKDVIRGTERHLVFKSDIKQNGPSLARSIFAFSSFGIAEHNLVRVWKTDFYSKLRPVEVFFSKVNLRYLCMTCVISGRRMRMRNIPSSVSLLWNLQTFIIHVGYIPSEAVVAPVEFWKMRQLRHVKCSYIYLPSPSDDLFVMDNLQTLTRVLNLRLTEQVCKMIPNIKKLRLHYDDDLQGYDDSLIECLRNLDCLHKLESLNLDFGDKSYRPPQLNMRVRFPISLSKLTLDSCQLRDEDLSIIGSLPQLQVLQLRRIRFMSDTEEWSPLDGQFLRLKYLYMNCYCLKYWYANKTHFPVLEKLVLGRSRLKEIPLSIAEIPTLELIRLEDCNESIAISAMRIKEDQLENHGNDDLQIQLCMDSMIMESFMKRVKREALNTNAIQLGLLKGVEVGRPILRIGRLNFGSG